MFYQGTTAPSGPGPTHYRGFTITIRHTIFGRNPLDEWSARRRDLYLTIHTNYNRETSMHSVGFQTTISAGERPQTHASDRANTGTGCLLFIDYKNSCVCPEILLLRKLKFSYSRSNTSTILMLVTEPLKKTTLTAQCRRPICRQQHRCCDMCILNLPEKNIQYVLNK